MTPHVAAARRAAAHALWAAAAGCPMEEAIELMNLCVELWPEGKLMVGRGPPLADVPSPKAWRNAAENLDQARSLQEAAMGIDRERAEAAEKLIEENLG